MAAVVVALIFLLIALAAAAFVVWPIMRNPSESIAARAVLASALALVVLGIGGGVYLEIGTPALAVRSLAGPDIKNMNSLITFLVERVHAAPGDGRAWVFLGEAYAGANDPNDAAKAFGKAVAVARTNHTLTPALLSMYGDALVQRSAGAVSPEAESIFRTIYAANPRDINTRFYLGLAHAARGENAQALALWRSLMADTPPNAPWHHELADRIAALSTRSGNYPAQHCCHGPAKSGPPR